MGGDQGGAQGVGGGFPIKPSSQLNVWASAVTSNMAGRDASVGQLRTVVTQSATLCQRVVSVVGQGHVYNLQRGVNNLGRSGRSLGTLVKLGYDQQEGLGTVRVLRSASRDPVYAVVCHERKGSVGRNNQPLHERAPVFPHRTFRYQRHQLLKCTETKQSIYKQLDSENKRFKTNFISNVTYRLLRRRKRPRTCQH